MKRETSSKQLCEAAVAHLREKGQVVTYPAGSYIVRRGEAGTAFRVILSGKAEVRLVSEEGVTLPLTRLGDRAFFGEMALLTGDPVSADVVALTPVTLLSLIAESFPAALSECIPLRDDIMVGLAANLRATSTDAWNFFQRARALTGLVMSGVHAAPLIAESPKMVRIAKQIPDHASNLHPILIVGEPGTGKLFLAAKIHQLGGTQERPFIVVDCSAIPDHDGEGFICGSLRLAAEEGPEQDTPTLHRYGALHLANQGTLVLRNIEVLEPLAQKSLRVYLDYLAVESIDFPKVRLIATTSFDPVALTKETHFDPGLGERLSRNIITVPRLLERRQDILPLAKQFLKEINEEGKDLRFNTSAEHALISLRFSHRNAAELREAVQMAALVAEGPEIRSEHIFSGPKEEGSLAEYDLTETSFLKRFTTGRLHSILKAGVLSAFYAIILFIMLFRNTTMGRIANSLLWGLWWPGMMILFLLVGRVWCSVCPFSSASRAIRRIKEWNLPPAEWIKKRSGWLITAGFILIICMENAFHMTERPLATGVLLLSIQAIAVACAVIFQREVWCRYLCPLGGLGAVYALPASLNVHANPGVCNTLCTTHECFKGAAGKQACPVFLHPLYQRDGHYCKLCLNCLSVCPHGSARLYLRVPFRTVWRLGTIDPALVPFALFVFFISIFMLASRNFVLPSMITGFSAMIVIALLLTVAASTSLPRLLSDESDPDPTLLLRVSFALLVLAWGPAMAFHLEKFPCVNSLRLQPVVGSIVERFFPAGGLSVEFLLQVAVILLAAFITAVILRRIKVNSLCQGINIEPLRWSILLMLCILYVVASIFLVLPWD
jgi:DNA-binding NtrC family response regulator